MALNAVDEHRRVRIVIVLLGERLPVLQTRSEKVQASDLGTRAFGDRLRETAVVHVLLRDDRHGGCAVSFFGLLRRVGSGAGVTVLVTSEVIGRESELRLLGDFVSGLDGRSAAVLLAG